MDKNKFLEKAKAAGRPTVVDFWAPWCGPCRMSKPILEKLAKEYQDTVDFWPINSDEHQQLIRDLKIYGIPTIMLIQNGKITGRFTGSQKEETYRQMFKALESGHAPQIPISPVDRLMRLGIGTITILFTLQSSTWWLLTLGLAILFTGLYDRCPIWKALTIYFKNHKKTSG